MLNQSDVLRVMAGRYLRMAKSAVDPRERSKFFDYAMIYAQLSEQAERRETLQTTAGKDRERRNVLAQRDVVARSHSR